MIKLGQSRIAYFLFMEVCINKIDYNVQKQNWEHKTDNKLYKNQNLSPFIVYCLSRSILY